MTMSDRNSSSIASGSVPFTPVRSTSALVGWSSRSTPTSSTGSTSSDTEIFWRTPTKSWKPAVFRSVSGWTFGAVYSFRHHFATRHITMIILCFVSALVFVSIPFHLHPEVSSLNAHVNEYYAPIRPLVSLSDEQGPDPIQWLQQNSDDKHAVSNSMFLPSFQESKRPKAALISLVRNSELEGMMQSVRQLEYRWNKNYQYPWIFFNDEPFTEEFKAGTQNSTSAQCFYAVVPKEHWSLPDWIDESRFMNSLDYLGTIGVGKGWMVSYHHMCRWNSGFFYKHPILKHYDWYWRVEPHVHYFCDIDYDVFRFMSDNGLKYGFNMNILDDARSFPSLWPRTRAFAEANPELLHPSADLEWLLDPNSSKDYNNCQFFSNFEIGSLNFWRGEANQAYFNWLDKAGGFYYERFGDAPVHTLSVAMFLAKREIWFFRDIGYQHDINHHCPPRLESKCSCEPTRMDENFYKLVPLESPQKKPVDTCIRQFLGGDWLEKKEDWTMVGEKAFGGDGYHGYALAGDE